MRASRLISILLGGIVLSGCAGFKFYKNANLTEETGIPICPANPYLLVKRTGAKDKPVEVSIEYISDRNKAIYAKPDSGWGSADLSLALSNCQLTSFGQKTDPKIAETLASVSGLITAKAGADKAGAEADQIRKTIAGTQQGADSAVKTGEAVTMIAKAMEADVKTADQKGGRINALSGDDLEKVKAAAQALTVAGKALADPANVNSADQYLAVVKAQTKILDEFDPVLATPRGAALDIVHGWANALKKILAEAGPEKPEPPTFELYEITQKDGVTTLKRADLK